AARRRPDAAHRPRTRPAGTRAVAATRYRARGGTGDRRTVLSGRLLPVPHPAGALQRRYGTGHPVPHAHLGRPVPDAAHPVQPALPRPPAGLGGAAPAGLLRGRTDGLASEDRPRRAQGGVAALRERRGSLPALPRAARQYLVRL